MAKLQPRPSELASKFMHALIVLKVIAVFEPLAQTDRLVAMHPKSVEIDH